MNLGVNHAGLYTLIGCVNDGLALKLSKLRFNDLYLLKKIIAIKIQHNFLRQTNRKVRFRFQQDSHLYSSWS